MEYNLIQPVLAAWQRPILFLTQKADTVDLCDEHRIKFVKVDHFIL